MLDKLITSLAMSHLSFLGNYVDVFFCTGGFKPQIKVMTS